MWTQAGRQQQAFKAEFLVLLAIKVELGAAP